MDTIEHDPVHAARRQLQEAIVDDILSKVPPTLSLNDFARLLGHTVEHTRRLVRGAKVRTERTASGVIVPLEANRAFLRGRRLHLVWPGPLPDRPEVRLLSVPVAAAAFDAFDAWARAHRMDHRRALERCFKALGDSLG